MSKATILVVEDDIHLLEGIRDILELDGYAVLMAENGVQGLEILRNLAFPPDLIVSDIMMPRMDGIQFYNEVRRENQWLSVPFIFLTAKGERSDQHRGMRMGVDEYIVKPYDPADLLVKIESRLERYRRLNQYHNSGMASLKRQILTMLNHEFRTPLTFVVAYADMLNEVGKHTLTEDEIMTYLRGVSSGADRLRRLIENFILLVELETGEARQTYEWRKVEINDLRPLFEEACARVPELASRPVEIEINGSLPPFIGDVEYLTAALTQYLTNAVKFSEERTPVTMGAHASPGQITLWVRDEGRGIPKSEHEKIWNTFYQIDREKNEDQGAGAGLAIVRQVAELHRGDKGLESDEGAGSTFYLHIPAA